MHDIENYMLEEHWELRQAATELMCNMSVYSETIKWFEDEKYDRLKVSTVRGPVLFLKSDRLWSLDPW